LTGLEKDGMRSIFQQSGGLLKSPWACRRPSRRVSPVIRSKISRCPKGCLLLLLTGLEKDGMRSKLYVVILILICYNNRVGGDCNE